MLDPAEGGVFGPGANGTGAYTMTEIEVSRRAVLEAVPDYWGEGPYLDRIEFIDVGGNEQAIVNALASKQVDGAFQILPDFRSEEHTSELQSLMRISYAVFCLKKKKHKLQQNSKDLKKR